MPDSPQGAWQALWAAETLRLRESLHGPLEDGTELRRTVAAGGSLDERLLYRARLLGEREGIPGLIVRWQQGARLTLLALALAAVLAGIGAATGALGDGSRPVNLLLALVALLGVNTLTLLLWFAGNLVQTDQLPWLGDAWLWLTRKLARGPTAALVPRALLELLSRERAVRPLGGVISHGLWLLALLSALATLLALLSARRYGFQWETTLLAPDTFVGLTHGLGLLPGLLGFPQPDAAMVHASIAPGQAPLQAQAMWSAWLVGTLLVYGLLPRALLLAWSVVALRRRLGASRLDPSLPGFAELRERLMPVATPSQDEAPPPGVFSPRRAAGPASSSAPTQAVLAAIEVPAEHPWPPPGLHGGVYDAGRIDSRAERQRLLQALYQHRPRRLLLAIDASQTPDRGTIALLAELASLADDTRIASVTTHERQALWKQQLEPAGLEMLPGAGLDNALSWLEPATPATPAAPTEAPHGNAT